MREEFIRLINACAAQVVLACASGDPTTIALAYVAVLVGHLPKLIARLQSSSVPRNRVLASVLPATKHSPWSFIKRSMNFQTYMSYVGLTVDCFWELAKKMSSALPHRIADRSTTKPYSLDPADVLGLVMRKLTGFVDTRGLCVEFCISSSTVTRGLVDGMRALRDTLAAEPLAAVEWPTLAKMVEYSHLIRDKRTYGKGAKRVGGKFPKGLPALPFGWIDGTVLPIDAPSDPAVRSLYFSGKHECCCVNNIFVFAPDGTIIYCITNQPGSFHDMNLSRGLIQAMLDCEEMKAKGHKRGYCLLGDTGFRSDASARVIATVRKEPSIPSDVGFSAMTAAEQAEELQRRQADKWISAHRSAIEWCFASLKCGFQRLRYPLPRDAEQRGALLDIIVGLHNYRIRHGGHPFQLATVYKPLLLQQQMEEVTAAEIGGAP